MINKSSELEHPEASHQFRNRLTFRESKQVTKHEPESYTLSLEMLEARVLLGVQAEKMEDTRGTSTSSVRFCLLPCVCWGQYIGGGHWRILNVKPLPRSSAAGTPSGDDGTLLTEGCSGLSAKTPPFTRRVKSDRRQTELEEGSYS